eukprot:g17533.t1
MSDYDLAVIGAGVVGVNTALWAALRGHRVVLIDPAAPGSGTSSGNACTIATYACLPVNDPSVLTGLPGLLLGSNTPLSVSWGHALRHPLWMLRFLANCRAKPSSRIAAALAGVLAHADAGLNPLIEAAGAQDLVVARGQISVWSTRAGGQGAEAGLIRRRDLGALVGRFHAAFLAKGGAHLSQRVLSVAQQGEGVVVSTDAGAVTARRAVVAAGAFSGRIAGSGAENLPLGTERGYHLMFRDEAARVTRPVGWGEGGFYAVPMARGLRLAGTVEIAGLEAPANAGRLAYLKRRGQEMLGPLPDPDSSWLGFRPTLPDSLPAIGFAPGSDRILHAFGHQHLGLTLGGITGRIITDLAEGRQPNQDIAAFDPGRAFS